jgi:acetolactate synthase-1/2/3 large subunit
VTTATGGRHLVQALAGAGVTKVFGVPGESFLGVLDALTGGPVEWVTARQEGAAAFMASAFAKVAGEVAVCMGTRAVGTSNMAIGVHNARQDSTPMLAVAGQVNRGFLGREAFQEVDLVAAMRPFCKWAAQVGTAAEVPEAVARALAAATRGRPGPAFISLPQDVCDEEAGADPVPLASPPRPPAPGEAVEEIVERMAAARRPLIFAGGGAVRSQADVDVLVELAEQLEVQVMLSWRHHDHFPNEHRLYAGTAGLGSAPQVWERLRQADVLLVVGNRLQENSTAGYRYPASTTRVLRIDIDPAPVAHVAEEMLVVADGPTALRQLAAAGRRRRAGDYPPASGPGEWAARRDANQRDRGAYLTATRLPDGMGGAEPGLSYPAVVAALGDLPPETIITTDAGNFYGWVARYHRFRRFRTYLGPASGAMGYSLPAAVGAKLAAADQPVVCVAGDGGLMMTVGELETAVRHGAGVVVAVLDNRRHGTIRMHQERHRPGRPPGPAVGTELGPVDFAALARAMGADGLTVEADDEVAPALAAAVSAGRPALIHCLMDRHQLSVDRRL